MAVVIASDLAKDMAGEPLLRGVSFKLERRDRLTLSGRNGSGKTTLLRMLSGETGIDGGELAFSKDVRISLHDQRPPRDRELSLRDYVLSGCKELLALEEQLASLEAAMAEGALDDATMSAYASAQTRLEHAGGYNWRESVNSTLHGLGFRDGDLDRSLATFSGGELTRASLARALAGDPDLLLLDEPTNHLDIESLEWLETHLQSLDAAIVLVAHDRWFLEAVGTSVLELEGGRSKFFKGTWHAWRAEKAQRELALGRAIEKQQAEIDKLQRFVDRFRAGTRSKQASSRQKKLDKIETLGRDPRDGKGLGFAFKPPERSGRVVFEVEDGLLKIGDRVLLQDAELWLERSEHVSLVGANGSGKTTLITALTGGREFDGGKLRTGHNVKLGLLSQHAESIGKGRTVLEACQRATGLTPNNARSLLGQFLFSGEDAEKPLDGLSGGERQRLSLAILVHSGVERPDPRRAHQPPGPGEPRGAGDGAAALPGCAVADLPRPRAAGRRGHADGRLGGPDAALLRGRLARVRAGARGARGRREGRQARQARGDGQAGSASEGRGAAARSLEERGRPREEARGADRGRRGRAGVGRGRARRPLGLERSARVRQVHGAPRRGQEARRGSLRAVRINRRIAP